MREGMCREGKGMDREEEGEKGKENDRNIGR